MLINMYSFIYITTLLVIASATVVPNRVNFDLHHQLNLPVADLTYTAPSELPAISLKARPITVYRPKSLDAHEHARLRSLLHAETEPIEWEQMVVSGPDIEDRHTLSQLARMTANAYQLPGHKNWYDLDSSWNANAVSPSPYYLCSLSNNPSRAFHSGGIMTKTDSAATFSLLETIPQSYCQSKEPRFRDLHQRKIN
jgi:putative lipase involved disintegration of autophagic bodies